MERLEQHNIALLVVLASPRTLRKDDNTPKTNPLNLSNTIEQVVCVRSKHFNEWNITIVRSARRHESGEHKQRSRMLCAAIGFYISDQRRARILSAAKSRRRSRRAEDRDQTRPDKPATPAFRFPCHGFASHSTRQKHGAHSGHFLPQCSVRSVYSRLER